MSGTLFLDQEAPMQPRISTMLVLGAMFVAGLSLSSASADGPKPCINANSEFAAVKAACAKGGQDEAKKMMKALVDKQKAAGNDIKCAGCHENLKDYKLKSNGKADLKKYL
jgi:hypothetical protein